MPRDLERNVRVYTVARESRYVLVRNVPALGVLDELLQRLRLYGDVCEFRVLDHDDALRVATNDDDDGGDGDGDGDSDATRARALDERFSEVVWVQFATVNAARHAKVRAVQKPFFGSLLQIVYAPQSESRADALLKLTQRRELLQRRARGGGLGGGRRAAPATLSSASGDFIGPQLPPRDWRPAPPLPPAPPPAERPTAPAPHSQPKRRRI